MRDDVATTLHHRAESRLTVLLMVARSATIGKSALGTDDADRESAP